MEDTRNVETVSGLGMNIPERAEVAFFIPLMGWQIKEKIFLTPLPGAPDFAALEKRFGDRRGYGIGE
jgi:hypothetical protein